MPSPKYVTSRAKAKLRNTTTARSRRGPLQQSGGCRACIALQAESKNSKTFFLPTTKPPLNSRRKSSTTRHHGGMVGGQENGWGGMGQSSNAQLVPACREAIGALIDLLVEPRHQRVLWPSMTTPGRVVTKSALPPRGFPRAHQLGDM